MRNSSKESVSRYRVFLLHENVISENVSDIYSASTRITQRDFFYFKQTTEIAVYRELVCSSLNKQAKKILFRGNCVAVRTNFFPCVSCFTFEFSACRRHRSRYRWKVALTVERTKRKCIFLGPMEFSRRCSEPE